MPHTHDWRGGWVCGGPDGCGERVTILPRDAKRIADLEALAREIVSAHRDVDGGADIPRHIYKDACRLLGIPS